jgi:heat shock protein HslJ
MHRYAAILFLGLALTTGCATAEDAKARPDGNWVASEIGGRPALADAPVTLDLRRDGSASGSAGCNRYMGKARVTADGLRFGPTAATKMACSDDRNEQETRYLDALGKAAGWRKDGSGLVLTSEDGAVLVRFKPAG